MPQAAAKQSCMILEHRTQARCFRLGVNFGEEGKLEYPEKNPQVRLRSTGSRPTYDHRGGSYGANVEYNVNLTSQSIQHRAARMVAHLDINPTRQDLPSVIKWERVFSLMHKPYNPPYLPYINSWRIN